MNQFVHANLKRVVKLHDITKTDEQHYKSKRRKVYHFNEYSLLIVF